MENNRKFELLLEKAAIMLNYKQRGFFEIESEKLLAVLLDFYKTFENIDLKHVNIYELTKQEKYKKILSEFIDAFEKHSFYQLKGMITDVKNLLTKHSENESLKKDEYLFLGIKDKEDFSNFISVRNNYNLE